MRVRVKLQARKEIRDVLQGLDQEKPSLGGELLAALKAAIAQIRQSPEMFGIYEGCTTRTSYRRYHLKRFRHLVVYEILDEEILIVAFAHTSREPGYWERR